MTKIKDLQDILWNQIERLSNDEIIKNGLGKRELQRNMNLQKTASTYLKSIDMNLKLYELKEKTKKDYYKEMGLK